MALSRLARWQTLTVITLFVGYAGYYFCRSNLSIATPAILAELGIGKQQFGQVASIAYLFYAGGKVVGGVLCDFLGGRRLFLFGMIASSTASVVFGLGNSLGFFIGVWSANRAVQSVGWGAVVKISSSWFPHRRHGTVMGILCMSYLFGDVIARAVLGLLARANWRLLFYYPAAILGAVTLFVTLLLKNSPEDIGEAEPEGRINAIFGDDATRGRPKSFAALLGPLLRSNIFWLICVLSFGLTLVRETFQTWTPTYLSDVAGFNLSQAAFGSILFPFWGGVSSPVAGYLSDRFGKGDRSAVTLIFLLLLTLCLFLLGRSSSAGASVGVSLALISAAGFFLIGPYTFLSGSISLDLGGKQASATAAGLADAVGYLGGYAAGAGMGYIAERHGWAGAFNALALVSLLSMLCAAAYWWLSHRRR